MIRFIATAVAIIWVLCALTSCVKEEIAINHGDLEYEYSPTFGDTISTVITTYGDTIFVNFGTVITVSDSSIYVGGNYTNLTVGDVVFDNTTNTTYTWTGDVWVGNTANTFYYFDNSTQIWVSYNVVNLCCATCAAGDTVVQIITVIDTVNTTVTDTITVQDTVVILVPAGMAPVQLTRPEDIIVLANNWYSGYTPLELFASGKLFHRWGTSYNSATFGTWELLDTTSGSFRSVSHMAGDTAYFNVSGQHISQQLMSATPGEQGPAYGYSFMLSPTAGNPATYTWANPSWLQLDSDASQGVNYIFRSAEVVALCPQHHLTFGWVLVPEGTTVYNFATATWQLP